VLPPEIGHLTSLRDLRLDGSQLTELASEVGAAAACGRGAAAGLDPLAARPGICRTLVRSGLIEAMPRRP